MPYICVCVSLGHHSHSFKTSFPMYLCTRASSDEVNDEKSDLAHAPSVQ